MRVPLHNVLLDVSPQIQVEMSLSVTEAFISAHKYRHRDRTPPQTSLKMNFELPPALKSHLKDIDSFIISKILPLQHSNDNNRFFDHRREYARTDWEHDGIPRREWEELLGKHRPNS